MCECFWGVAKNTERLDMYAMSSLSEKECGGNKWKLLAEGKIGFGEAFFLRNVVCCKEKTTKSKANFRPPKSFKLFQ